MFEEHFTLRPCVLCGLEILVSPAEPLPVCTDCAADVAELEALAELERLRDGIGTADELADYDATRRLLQGRE